ncbi:hypothetical protein [Bradyrhizobium sp. SK17]|jgi:hypothetical protein|uniref:hypothetical protein n=1 Tax=Bradyrhizobium sp. SK17 TaxID=2057741 RepID=UPI0012FD3DB8|nr:hypothetical protein [Bradyrhizobium sp. SK17]
MPDNIDPPWGLPTVNHHPPFAISGMLGSFAISLRLFSTRVMLSAADAAVANAWLLRTTKGRRTILDPSVNVWLECRAKHYKDWSRGRTIASHSREGCFTPLSGSII